MFRRNCDGGIKNSNKRIIIEFLRKPPYLNAMRKQQKLKIICLVYNLCSMFRKILKNYLQPESWFH